MAAVQGLPPASGFGPGTVARPARSGAADVDQLAARWAGLALGPARTSPALHARLVALLHRLAARCRDEPFRPARSRALGADVLHSGLCGEVDGPPHPAEDLLPPTLALLREQAPGVLALIGAARRRLPAVLDELAAGFAAALRVEALPGDRRAEAPEAATEPIATVSACVTDRLPEGVARRELRLEYQPLVGLSDGRWRGVEALVRWQHPEHGLLEPVRFVEAAERSGAIVPLGRWVLEEACTQAAGWWRERGATAPWVSVNVSPVELALPGWADGVEEVIDLTGLPPDRLQLEITEQATLTDETTSLAALHAVRELGVRLALDDFGTGWSGLTWLRRLPVHAIKIDGSFVDGLRHPQPDPVDLAIVRGAVRMAHEIDIEVTAEWVETITQVEQLAALGCDLGQGRWWGGAGPAAWVERMSARTIG